MKERETDEREKTRTHAHRPMRSVAALVVDANLVTWIDATSARPEAGKKIESDD